jgi:hypothetical protein
VQEETKDTPRDKKQDMSQELVFPERLDEPKSKHDKGGASVKGKPEMVQKQARNASSVTSDSHSSFWTKDSNLSSIRFNNSSMHSEHSDGHSSDGRNKVNS